MTELYIRLKNLYKDSTKERDKPIQNLTWNYRRSGPQQEPVVDDIVKEINGYTVADGKVVKGFTQLKAMAVPPVAAGFSLVLCRKRERTWRVVATPTRMSASTGALPGRPIATFSITVLPPILKA